MKRDAFDQQAENASSDSWSGDAFAVSIKATAKLLRAQHRSFVRLVERQIRWKQLDNVIHSSFDGEYLDRARLLNALAAQGKGGKR